MTHVFRRVRDRELPVAARAHGAWIEDTDGRRYLDAAGGAIVVNVGHGDPALLAAMADQAKAVDYVHGTAFTTDALDRKSTRLNSSHSQQSRMPSSA